MTATRLHHRGTLTLPSIRATVVAGKDDVNIRISDQGKYNFFWPCYLLLIHSPGGGLLTSCIKSPSDLFSFSHVRNSARMERSRLGALRTVSSHPRGIMATVEEQIGRRRHQKPKHIHPETEGAELAMHPRIGIGLPMSNIFCT